MRHFAITTFVACAVLFCSASAADAEAANGAVQAQAPASSALDRETETPALRQRIAGTLVMTARVGGIVAVDLATLQSKSLRPANAGRAPIHTLSEPDEDGRVMFVTGIVSKDRTYAVHATKGEQEQTLFTGPGDPLWDNAISPISLAPRGDLAAFVAQPAENAGKRFRPLAKGPLRLWDSTTSATRELAITAAGERPPRGFRMVAVWPTQRQPQFRRAAKPWSRWCTYSIPAPARARHSRRAVCRLSPAMAARFCSPEESLSI